MAQKSMESSNYVIYKEFGKNPGGFEKIDTGAVNRVL
jgi:hypothetical protein